MVLFRMDAKKKILAVGLVLFVTKIIGRKRISLAEISCPTNLPNYINRP